MTKIAIITGGDNGERDISLKSAQNIYDNLDKSKYEIQMFDFPNQKNEIIDNMKYFDLVIPVIHGTGGEDGLITNFCKFSGIPYLFSDPENHSLCLNKYLTYKFVESFGVSIPKTYLIQIIEDIELIDIKGKIFIKPCNGGSSVDCGVYDNISEAKPLIEKILRYDEVLVQEYILKEREFTVSIINDYNRNPQIIAISEVITSKEVFDYDAKYFSDQAEEVVHSNLDDGLKDKISNLAIQIYKRCKVKTFGRIDFLFSNNKIYFLEVNTIPGFTKVSFVPQALNSNNINISELFDEYIHAELLTKGFF